MPSSPKPTLTWLASALEKLGIDLHKLDLKPKYRAALLDDEQAVSGLGVNDYLAVLQTVADYTGNPEIGLALGNQIDARQMGLYGYIQLNASSVRELVTLTTRYFATLDSYAEYRFHRGRHSSRLEYAVLAPTRLPLKNDITSSIAYQLHLFREHLGSDWQPISVCFSFAEPDELSEYHRYCGSNVLFSQPANMIELDNADLDTVINDTDPQLLQVVIRQAEQVLAQSTHSESLADKVRLQLMNTLGDTGADQNSISRRLYLSPTTLRRRLRSEGKNFRQIRDEIIYQLATEALSTTDAPISQIAFKLGYSELSAFDHAFTRLSGGVAPRSYRQRIS